MEVGLLWYDNDSERALEDKIGRAAQRYQEKYGRWPNTCYVHPQVMDGAAGQELRLAFRRQNRETMIRVVSAPNVLLHHFWVGESAEQASQKQTRAAA
jgi:hypothetical protein